jgi:transposase
VDNQFAVFAAALGLTPPWKVTGTTLSVEGKRFDIRVDFPRGGAFACPTCGKQTTAYDTSEQTWRHLNFFQYAAYVTARVPRLDCPDCGVKQVEVPWSRPGSGFTLLFEALVMALAREMPIQAVAELVGEHDTRLWRVVHHYVDEARARADHSQVRQVGVDETASRRGHNYISVFVDLERRQMLFGTSGKNAATVKAFAEDLETHGGACERIKEVACDMSAAFIKGLSEQLPQAEITFDRFHIQKVVNEGVDKVRREESSEVAGLKKTRWVWLKNPAQLTTKQRATIEQLTRRNLKTSRAYQMKLTFQELFAEPDRAAGEAFLKRWYYWATHSRLEPMMEAARTIKAHWEGVLNWFDSHLTTGLLEGINSLLQAAKSRARGYRSDRNFIAIAYLIAGKLDFRLPT